VITSKKRIAVIIQKKRADSCDNSKQRAAVIIIKKGQQ